MVDGLLGYSHLPFSLPLVGRVGWGCHKRYRPPPTPNPSPRGGGEQWRRGTVAELCCAHNRVAIVFDHREGVVEMVQEGAPLVVTVAATEALRVGFQRLPFDQ